MNRREFGKAAAVASGSMGLSILSSCASTPSEVECYGPFEVSDNLSEGDV